MLILLSSAPRYVNLSNTESYGVPKGVNGGVVCVACTALVALTEQLSVVHNVTFVEAYVKLCDVLPNLYRNACISLGEYYIPQAIKLIEAEFTADVICHAIHLCYKEKGQPFCHAFPPKKDIGESVSQAKEEVASKLLYESARLHPPKDPAFDPCTLEGVKELCQLFNKVFTNDLPLIDLDNDTYSASVEAWRGTSWRGRDCDDINHLSHPGAKPRDWDIVFDSNCNGIHGKDPIFGKPYEELLCKDSGYLGVIVLGDSVAAHFHIPPEWLTARLFSARAFDNVAFMVENEMDWPQLSLYTGYLRSSRWPMERGHGDSIYLKLWERNHCNHRDYQNLAKNGADSFEANSRLIKSMARDQKLDQPALVFYSLVGNDVCHARPDLSTLTTPQEMRRNVLETLKGLDERLPNGSHVILIGLVDGRVLYDSLHNRIHPIGSLRNDVTYEQFYDFMNCLQVSPCFGWMNSNETIRNLTSERAAQLSAVLKNVAETMKYENLEVYYFDCPLEEVIRDWKRKGHLVFQLIEPVDGFHPNLLAESLAAKVMWRLLESKIPHVLGKVNPHNEIIRLLFGDQGGY